MTTDSQFLLTLSHESRSGAPTSDIETALHVVAPPAAVTRLAPARVRVVLGRNPPDRTWQLHSRLVSRQHLAISFNADEQTHHITDLGSHNGTRVDGEPLRSGYRRLRHGDVIRAGDILMVYERGPRIQVVPAALEAAIPGVSMAVRRLRSDIMRIARDPSPVLLIGETGAGKEKIAAAIHQLSERAGPLVAVNCATLGTQLVESELFGHVRGAFTGATAARTGLFQTASGGTLLLDEIGEMPLDLQPKLLRAIQEGEIRPVGSNRPIPVDTRIVAATNRDLSSLVESGGFRRDLYARLALWEISVPPIRQRRADILAWVHRFHASWLAERDASDTRPLQLSVTLGERLLLHPWPMNLRGIQRVVHHLASLEAKENALSVHDLPDSMRAPSGQPADEASMPERVAHVEQPEQSTTTAGSRATESTEPRATEPRAGVAQSVKDRRPPAPRSADELQAILTRCGSVSATARHYGRDRRQIYRWLDAFGLR